MTNIKLLLTTDAHDVNISATCRGHVLDVQYAPKEISITGKITLPSKLSLSLINLHGSFVKLQKIQLGSIAIPNNTISQICNVTDIYGKSFISSYWKTPGTIYIDFFSSDFIQYHLINGHKLFNATVAA